ncbi:hypothetical protein BLNAU_10969 [Blattamonas nauphoetae]|uniref:Uncharacterized protein n=1 Tax=Blattamonas nauphoetae TaxID=2049346 RepID=A0ABQ9XRI0_9EUKA|nr:hypothetical protein BLNAU_10969 [Blattamonas nauphoetae]
MTASLRRAKLGTMEPSLSTQTRTASSPTVPSFYARPNTTAGLWASTSQQQSSLTSSNSVNVHQRVIPTGVMSSFWTFQPLTSLLTCSSSANPRLARPTCTSTMVICPMTISSHNSHQH